MICYKCDICSKDCDNIVSYRHEYVIGELGVEIIILRGNNPTGNTHLCEECVFNMLFTILDKSNNRYIQDLKSRLRNLDNREARISVLEDDLVKRENKIDALEKELHSKQLDFDKNEYEIKSKVWETEKADLLGQIFTLKANKDKDVKQAWINGRQAGLDENDENKVRI